MNTLPVNKFNVAALFRVYSWDLPFVSTRFEFLLEIAKDLLWLPQIFEAYVRIISQEDVFTPRNSLRSSIIITTLLFLIEHM
jgi:hypothetical protein